MQTISLDGLWSVKQADSHEIYAAQVPGCIHLDLLSAEAIPDHNWRDNEEKNLWVAEKDWTWSIWICLGLFGFFGYDTRPSSAICKPRI